MDQLSPAEKKKIYVDAKNIGNNYIELVKRNNFYNVQYPAVMFDIDDTLIDYSGNSITPIIELLKKCKKMGFLVMIITARDSAGLDYTVQQLKTKNIPYDLLYLREPGADIEHFKSQIKEKLKKDFDLTVLMSVGDNMMDVVGDYSGYCIKLPNQFDKNLYYSTMN